MNFWREIGLKHILYIRLKYQYDQRAAIVAPSDHVSMVPILMIFLINQEYFFLASFSSFNRKHLIFLFWVSFDTLLHFMPVFCCGLKIILFACLVLTCEFFQRIHSNHPERAKNFPSKILKTFWSVFTMFSVNSMQTCTNES